MPRPIVTLTTDFGHSSSYVAQMKGVILARNPGANLVDLSHSIRPQDVRQAALFLEEVVSRFPPRTLHVAVVDPGVGTDRRIVFAKIEQQCFLAPDNGLLSHLARRSRPEQLVEVSNALYFLPEISATFHGRDIFAPVAAHLSLGLNPARLGPALDSIVMLPPIEPVLESNRIHGTIVAVDTFGNLITNITADDLRQLAFGSEVRVRCRNEMTTIVARTYGEHPPGTLVALIGSSDQLELAVVQGSAAAKIGANVYESVEVERVGAELPANP